MTPALVLLITPTDRQHHAQRLRDAGFQVITTSRAASTIGQILGSGSTVMAIELVASLSDETIAFADNLARRRPRQTPLIIYGLHASAAARTHIENLGATWVDAPQESPALVEAVRAALAGPESVGSHYALPEPS